MTLDHRSTSHHIALHAMRREPDDPGPTGMDSDAMFGDARAGPQERAECGCQTLEVCAATGCRHRRRIDEAVSLITLAEKHDDHPETVDRRPGVEAAVRYLTRRMVAELDYVGRLIFGAIAIVALLLAWAVFAPPLVEAVEPPCEMGETCGRAM